MSRLFTGQGCSADLTGGGQNPLSKLVATILNVSQDRANTLVQNIPEAKRIELLNKSPMQRQKEILELFENVWSTVSQNAKTSLLTTGSRDAMFEDIWKTTMGAQNAIKLLSRMDKSAVGEMMKYDNCTLNIYSTKNEEDMLQHMVSWAGSDVSAGFIYKNGVKEIGFDDRTPEYESDVYTILQKTDSKYRAILTKFAEEMKEATNISGPDRDYTAMDVKKILRKVFGKIKNINTYLRERILNICYIYSPTMYEEVDKWFCSIRVDETVNDRSKFYDEEYARSLMNDIKNKGYVYEIKSNELDNDSVFLVIIPLKKKLYSCHCMI